MPLRGIWLHVPPRNWQAYKLLFFNFSGGLSRNPGKDISDIITQDLSIYLSMCVCVYTPA